MKKTLQVSFLILIFIAASVTYAISSKNADEVKKLLSCKVDQVIEILKSKELTDEEKKEKVVKIITPMFDFELMSKLSLGKRHWRELSPEQRKEFTHLFVERLKASYMDKLSFYNGQVIKYGTPKEKKRIIIMPSTIVSKDSNDNIEMLYKFWHSPEGWKIYDIEIQGISIIRTYRAQFNQVLNNKGIDGLLDTLRKTGKQDTKEKKA